MGVKREMDGHFPNHWMLNAHRKKGIGLIIKLADLIFFFN